METTDFFAKRAALDAALPEDAWSYWRQKLAIFERFMALAIMRHAQEAIKIAANTPDNPLIRASPLFLARSQRASEKSC